MKPELTAHCILMLLGASTINQLKAQSEIEIDPRQYVTVMYKKVPTSGILDTIWNWEKRKNVPNQKFYFLDADGSIKINFDKTSLSLNREFEGTFSLEAEVSGLNGTRRIEVNPYSEIGVQRIPIGIKSEPPTELAYKLLNVLKELNRNGTSSIQGMRDTTLSLDLNRKILLFNSFRTSYPQRLAAIDLRDSSITRRDLNAQALSIVNEILDNSGMSLSQNDRVKIEKYFQSETRPFKPQFDDLKLITERYINSTIANYGTELKGIYGLLRSKLETVLDYLTSFESAGDDALKAFLTLINKDVVNYKRLKGGLMALQVDLKKIDLSGEDTLQNLILLNKFGIIQASYVNMQGLSRFEGSRLEKIIDSIRLKNTALYNKSYDEDYLEILNRFNDQIAERISIEAARMIYKKLIYATIDLGKSGAKDGEVLNVYVTWMLGKRDSLSNSPRLPIGKYYLRETGWAATVTDMFALVKRINESKVDQTKVSPSNFKGSGGAVLMWTYRSEDRGLKIYPKKIVETDTTYSVERKRSFINFLQPSIGLNVSYLDFSTEKDVEIGTGLQVGLFRNKIFFGYGYNLHMISPRGQSPNYFYIGFSFAKLDDLFKGSGSIKSLN